METNKTPVQTAEENICEECQVLDGYHSTDCSKFLPTLNQYDYDQINEKLEKESAKKKFSNLMLAIADFSSESENLESKQSARNLLNETLKNYNKTVSQVYWFSFSNRETDLFVEMMHDFAAQQSAAKEAEFVAELDVFSNLLMQAIDKRSSNNIPSPNDKAYDLKYAKKFIDQLIQKIKG